MQIKKAEPVPREEQETVCVYDYELDSWSLYTCVRKHITRLTKIFSEDEIDRVFKDDSGRIVAIQIDDVDPSQVSFRNKSKKKNLSDEEKREIADRMKKARRQND